MCSHLGRDGDEVERLSDDEVVDHMIFLLMAAHDTTTSALTTLVEALARHPSWQERLREEALSRPDVPIGPADLDLPLCGDAADRTLPDRYADRCPGPVGRRHHGA